MDGRTGLVGLGVQVIIQAKRERRRRPSIKETIKGEGLWANAETKRASSTRRRSRGKMMMEEEEEEERRSQKD